MKKITLDKDYLIPERWEEVTLKMQMKVSADDAGITIPELKKFAILSGYANIPIESIKKAKLTELTELFKTMTFLNKDMPSEQLIEFDFKGKHYYCGQNLVDMAFEDFISIENVIQAHSGNSYQALPIILAIMCKQRKADGIFETVSDYDVMQRAKEFEELPITTCNSLSLFFSNSVNMFSQVIPLFLNPEVEAVVAKNQITEIESMLNKLAGKGLLTRFAVGILRYSLKYTKRLLHKHSISTQ